VCIYIHIIGRSDLLYRQMRPTIDAKEAYYRGKRDLQKAPEIVTVQGSGFSYLHKAPGLVAVL
jgi:hypothetical protein